MSAIQKPASTIGHASLAATADTRAALLHLVSSAEWLFEGSCTYAADDLFEMASNESGARQALTVELQDPSNALDFGIAVTGWVELVEGHITSRSLPDDLRALCAEFDSADGQHVPSLPCDLWAEIVETSIPFDGSNEQIEAGMKILNMNVVDRPISEGRARLTLLSIVRAARALPMLTRDQKLGMWSSVKTDEALSGPIRQEMVKQIAIGVLNGPTAETINMFRGLLGSDRADETLRHLADWHRAVSPEPTLAAE